MLELPKQILIREVDLINICKNKQQKYMILVGLWINLTK